MNHYNLLVVHFLPFAGGKFFINCLSHNPGILPGLCVASPIHTYDHWIFDNSDDITHQKIKRINSTIPSAIDMPKWASYELGCNQFWGGIISQITKDQVPSVESLALLQNNVCFIVNHSISDLDIARIIEKWPNARHIVLHNHIKFQEVAMKIKSGQGIIQEVKTTKNPEFFYVDVDNTYTDVNRVKTVVSDCIKWLGLESNLDENFNGYVSKYLKLHQQ